MVFLLTSVTDGVNTDIFTEIQTSSVTLACTACYSPADVTHITLDQKISVVHLSRPETKRHCSL